MITGKYRDFYNRIKETVPENRMFHDALCTLAYGTDASFYRLIPKLVIKSVSESEVQAILSLAGEMGLPVTFRAGGTSLSGQSISDSILVIASHGWDKMEILDNGNKIKMQPGVRGGYANARLARYGRILGPDPASIDSAMIGGIVANNASGMSCNTVYNSYRTLADIRVILPDGTLLDTSDRESVESFRKSHKRLIAELEDIASYIAADVELRDKIKKKYIIKNTTGYSINSFIDYSDGIDILKHLIVGSEGTLAFISDITMNTIAIPKYKSLALAVFPDINEACKAVQILKSQPVDAVEILDRAAIRSVDQSPDIPEYLKTLESECCALLIEIGADDVSKLTENVNSVKSSISTIKTVLPYEFTTDAREQAILWKVRKETLPTVAGMRKSGTTAIIEDVCFPVDKLADAVKGLQGVFSDNGYGDAGIFGHAMAGNLHFMFNQDFGTTSEVERYNKFMNEIADFVVNKYDGSLKAEHGTGRNMAPFVKKEWGEKAYKLMKEIKEAFDPKMILNPGVILNNDPLAHIKNLKPTSSIKPVVDKCMECGFCECYCTAEGKTLSPRQRVAVYREMERLKASGEEPHRAAEMQKLYKYYGIETCATDSLCNLHCPVKADTGKLVKELRYESHSAKGEKRAVCIEEHLAGITSFARGGLKCLNGIRLFFGKKAFGAMASAARWITFNAIPQWNEHIPTGADKIKTCGSGEERAEKVVYFPSCITRSMGTSKSYCKEKELTGITETLLKAAGYQIIYPEGMNSLCCGMAFSSKGYVEAGRKASDKLKAALVKASENGKYPILCDNSPCLYTMHENMDDGLKLYEPAEFTFKFLLDKLNINKVNRKVAVFTVCSSKKLGVDTVIIDIARRCASDVTVIESNCCGFAGDRGFLYPEMNEHGLRMIKDQIRECVEGYATSRTCEIGLAKNGGIRFTSLLYLVAEAAGINIMK